MFDKLKPAVFRYNGKNGTDVKKIQMGVMAQDIVDGLVAEGLNPEEFGIIQKNEYGYYMVDYVQLIPILISRIKKLEEKVGDG